MGKTSSPRTFGEHWSWPRAGTVTPPRQKTPPNFSWAAARAAPCVAWKDNGGGVMGQHDFPKEKSGEGSDRGDHFAADDRFVADKLDTATEEEGGWEAVWARRFARGNIHTEYQDRFLWPPPGTSSAPGRAAAPSKTPSHFATDATTAAGPMTRYRAGAQGSSAPKGEKSAAKVRSFDEEVGANVMASAPRRASPPPQELQPFSPPPSSKRSSDISTSRVEGRTQGVRDRLLSEAVGSHLPAAARPAEELMGSDQGSAWEVGEHVGVAGDGAVDVNGQDVARPGTATAVAAPLQSNLAGAGVLLRGASREQALKDEENEDDTLGSRSATMRGGKTIDYSSQSILTEYMEEFVWPVERPAPGRRGKRTGMGMDHVGRLLAGKRAEEPRKEPDPSLVTRLGVAADRELKSATRANLAEICCLKSPPPAVRRLALGLAVALGLRWRRWSDIRTRLLRNVLELTDILQRFDKDRAGLTSASIRPFAEDPNLSPAEVRTVATSVVWLSRWLRALYDYLAVKEGNADGIPLDRMLSDSALATGEGGAAARTRQRVRSNAPRTVVGTVPESAAPATATARARRFTSDSAKIGGNGALAGDDVTENAGLSVAALARMRISPVGDAPEGLRAGAGGAAVTVEGGSVAAEKRRSENRPRRKGSPRRRASSLTIDYQNGKEERGSRAPSGADGDGVEAAGREGKSADDDGDLGSESVWTIGTLTSRGDVLETPTEDLVDLGSTSSMVRGPNALAAKERSAEGNEGNGGKAQGGAEGPRGCTKENVRDPGRKYTAGLRRRETGREWRGRGQEGAEEDTPRRKVQRQRGASGGGGGGGPLRARKGQLSHACVYRHQPKGQTASRFANPKARRLPHESRNPILAHTRWPPPLEPREREKTEQRSAFSLEHSFVAVEAGLNTGM